ncbi:MAG: TIGR02206 family membrane protein [Candidatus Poribacteria bacterium]|nr:TIGR02206 family membrane protein [Candidatus Poribacteria bacterium]MDE0506383.1 TIGR02206 family membrane protein [Candidatus Poribacteria bacterium]
MPNFQTFSTSHLIVMLLTLAVPILLAAIARRRAAATIGYFLAGVIMVNEVTNWCYRFAEVGFEQFVEKHLPLHFCGIAVFATVATLVFRNERAYEIAYFWGLVGTLNAVITPSLAEGEGFPSYRFFQYFIAHSGIVAGVLYATIRLRMRPTLRGLLRAFVCANLFAVAVGAFNSVMNSNYMFLCVPPETASPFFFAPWPWYIPILDVVALGLFFVVFSPFLVSGWWSARKSAG